jgi:phage tail-like protein
MTGFAADPIAGFRFVVQIEGVIAGYFAQCAALTEEREVVTYAEGGVNGFAHQLPGRIKKSRITLKRGLVNSALWEWFEAGVYDARVKRRHVSVIVYRPDLTEARRWDLPNAYPAKWGGPALQADGDQLAVETLELVSEGSGSGQSSGGTSAGPDPDTTQEPAVDVNALALKVYDLLRRDVSLERERLGRTWP